MAHETDARLIGWSHPQNVVKDTLKHTSVSPKMPQTWDFKIFSNIALIVLHSLQG